MLMHWGQLLHICQSITPPSTSTKFSYFITNSNKYINMYACTQNTHSCTKMSLSFLAWLGYGILTLIDSLVGLHTPILQFWLVLLSFGYREREDEQINRQNYCKYIIERGLWHKPKLYQWQHTITLLTNSSSCWLVINRYSNQLYLAVCIMH